VFPDSAAVKPMQGLVGERASPAHIAVQDQCREL